MIMNNELDDRAILTKIIGHMNDSDAKQMPAYAAGYEAGGICQTSSFVLEQSGKSVVEQTA